MDILLVTPEIAPYARFSDVGDAAAALPKALRGLGHRVTVVSPLWPSIDPSARHLARRLTRYAVEVGGEERAFALYEGRSAGGVDLNFLGEAELFSAGAGSRDEDSAAARRWGAFCRAVASFIERRAAMPDVVHLYGWQTAPLALLLREKPATAHVPTVLSIHDATSQGVFEREQMAEYGIGQQHYRLDGVEFFGRFSALKAGVQYATALTTPAPSHAASIRSSEGAGLEGALAARGGDLVGILHGVDASVWNAATDPHLESRFDPMDVAGNGRFGKLRCKSAFQRELELPARDDVALVGAIGEVAAGNALALLIEALPRIVRNDVQIAIVCEGEGDQALLEKAEAAARRWSDRVAVVASADAPLVHRAYSASDAVVAATLGGPWAAEAMQAQRYGALPVGFAAGAYADAVVDCDPGMASGTGFAFREASADAVAAALGRVVAGFAERSVFRSLAQRAMLVDHSWERAARLHERLYRGARSRLAPADADSVASEART